MSLFHPLKATNYTLILAINFIQFRENKNIISSLPLITAANLRLILIIIIQLVIPRQLRPTTVHQQPPPIWGVLGWDERDRVKGPSAALQSVKCCNCRGIIEL